MPMAAPQRQETRPAGPPPAAAPMADGPAAAIPHPVIQPEAMRVPRVVQEAARRAATARAGRSIRATRAPATERAARRIPAMQRAATDLAVTATRAMARLETLRRPVVPVAPGAPEQAAMPVVAMRMAALGQVVLEPMERAEPEQVVTAPAVMEPVETAAMAVLAQAP